LHGAPQTLLVSESGLAHPEVVRLLAGGLMPEPVVLSDVLFTECATVQSPLGIAAIIAIPSLTLPAGPLGPCLMLEDIQDPGNLGTLLRSAAAAGIPRAFLSPGCALAWAPRVLRAGMGAHFQIALYEGVALPELARRFEGRVLGAALQEAHPYFDADLRGPVALVIGNEGGGISPELLAQVHERVHIPMAPGIESLNAAVAGSILMYERLRQQSR
ncbi:MAG: RNA methyltransferase, partial [Ferrovum sp.]|nr:RNA methyltransferase [Ferrovum sp.]